MALFAPAGGVGAISGSVGGIVFSHNRFGQYIRLRSIPVNPNTNRQSAVRAAVGLLASAWINELSQAQRDVWEIYGANISRTNKVGGAIKLTGFNHFLRSNVQAKVSGAIVVFDGPANLSLPAQDPTIVATIDEASQQISLAFDDTQPWAAQATGIMEVYMSQPHNVGTNFIGGPYRFAGNIDGTAPGPTASPQVVTAPFVVAATQVVKIAVRIREEDSRITDRFFHQSIVTA